MRCKNCGGPVYHDSMYRSKTFIDLACIMCGKRWHVPATNALARLILSDEGVAAGKNLTEYGQS